VSALARIVSHRRLVLPQLGAPGVAAHQVREATGFHVTYGPVRAADLPAFLDARMKATDDMRRVRFGLRDRVVLVPVEVVMGGAYAIGIAAAMLLVGGLNSSGYSLAAIQARGIPSALMIAGSFVAATLLGPALLPWLPGRAFAVKGAVLGLALVATLLVFGSPAADLFGSRLHVVAWTFLAPALTSFIVMNFTGSSTFTSLSGVLLEMRYAVPLQISGAVTGLAFWVAGLFIA
jgi:acetyl-CoA decarbonylase/synthase complex subunit gamma